MYYTSPTNAFFFVFFIITSVFYLHSLVLSVVFQTYIQAATDIYERSSSDRENAVRLAYLALMKDETSECISASSVRKTLQVVRPHYSSLKVRVIFFCWCILKKICSEKKKSLSLSELLNDSFPLRFSCQIFTALLFIRLKP